MASDYRRHGEPLFFPIALITIGVIWLLINNNTIPAENVLRLLPFWPVLLIAGGLSLLASRIWWPLGTLVWAAVAVGAVLLLLAPPSMLPQFSTTDLKHETFREPLGEAQSASVLLDLSVNPTHVYALEGSDDLILADLNYMGNIIFDVTGSETKNVLLDERSVGAIWNIRWDAFLKSGDETQWQIGLSPDVLLQLTVNGGTGSTDLDLTGLELESLTVDGGTGSMRIALPEDSRRFPINLDGGTGSVTITVPENLSFDLTADGGTGSLNIDIPDDAGVRVEVRDGGVGSVNLSGAFKRISGGRGDEGVWETDAYATTETPIKITLDVGTGSVTIR